MFMSDARYGTAREYGYKHNDHSVCPVCPHAVRTPPALPGSRGAGEAGCAAGRAPLRVGMDHCFLSFSPRKRSTLSPHIDFATRSRLDGLSDRPRRKGSRGASLGDVPLASGQARQQLTSLAACEEAVFLRFVQNEPLERSLSVRES